MSNKHLLNAEAKHNNKMNFIKIKIKQEHNEMPMKMQKWTITTTPKRFQRCPLKIWK
jgi:hypothetical protein